MSGGKPNAGSTAGHVACTALAVDLVGLVQVVVTDTLAIIEVVNVAIAGIETA